MHEDAHFPYKAQMFMQIKKATKEYGPQNVIWQVRQKARKELTQEIKDRTRRQDSEIKLHSGTRQFVQVLGQKNRLENVFFSLSTNFTEETNFE